MNKTCPIPSSFSIHMNDYFTYASGSWENVDWGIFDIVGIDYYREKFTKKTYREKLRTYFKHGKPVVSSVAARTKVLKIRVDTDGQLLIETKRPTKSPNQRGFYPG
jgi:hypothetical protein